MLILITKLHYPIASTYAFFLFVVIQDNFYRFNHTQAKQAELDRESEQKRESQRIANWSLGVDIFMTTVKGAVGWMLNSSAILADISFSSVFSIFL